MSRTRAVLAACVVAIASLGTSGPADAVIKTRHNDLASVVECVDATETTPGVYSWLSMKQTGNVGRGDARIVSADVNNAACPVPVSWRLYAPGSDELLGTFCVAPGGTLRLTSGAINKVAGKSFDWTFERGC
jgi:hypothetical protein